jgi:hypothetical protein
MPQFGISNLVGFRTCAGEGLKKYGLNHQSAVEIVASDYGVGRAQVGVVFIHSGTLANAASFPVFSVHHSFIVHLLVCGR